MQVGLTAHSRSSKLALTILGWEQTHPCRVSHCWQVLKAHLKTFLLLGRALFFESAFGDMSFGVAMFRIPYEVRMTWSLTNTEVALVGTLLSWMRSAVLAVAQLSRT